MAEPFFSGIGGLKSSVRTTLQVSKPYLEIVDQREMLVNKCTYLFFPSRCVCLLSLGPCLSAMALYLIWLQRSLLLSWPGHASFLAYCDSSVCCRWTTPFHSLSHCIPSDLKSPTTSVIRILHRIKTSWELFLCWFPPPSLNENLELYINHSPESFLVCFWSNDVLPEEHFLEPRQWQAHQVLCSPHQVIE